MIATVTGIIAVALTFIGNIPDQRMDRLNFSGAAIIAAVPSQDKPAQAETERRLEKLRAELRDNQSREADAQARLKQLEIDLQPDNLQRAISHIGSFKPEELREQRRIQLESEKKKVSLQLEQLTENRVRLEKAIAEAQTVAPRTADSKADGAPKVEESSGAQPVSSTRASDLKWVSGIEPPAPARRQPARKTRTGKKPKAK